MSELRKTELPASPKWIDPDTPQRAELDAGVRSSKRPVSLTPKEVPAYLSTFAPGHSGNPSGQFKPGVSGNPSGRKLRRPISEAIQVELDRPYTGNCKRWRDRKYTNAQALAAKQVSLAIHNGDMRAAEEIANRIEGKVVSVQQLQGPDGGPIEISALTPEEKAARIRELMAKVGI